MRRVLPQGCGIGSLAGGRLVFEPAAQIGVAARVDAQRGRPLGFVFEQVVPHDFEQALRPDDARLRNGLRAARWRRIRKAPGRTWRQALARAWRRVMERLVWVMREGVLPARKPVKSIAEFGRTWPPLAPSSFITRRCSQTSLALPV